MPVAGTQTFTVTVTLDTVPSVTVTPSRIGRRPGQPQRLRVACCGANARPCFSSGRSCPGPSPSRPLPPSRPQPLAAPLPAPAGCGVARVRRCHPARTRRMMRRTLRGWRRPTPSAAPVRRRGAARPRLGRFRSRARPGPDQARLPRSGPAGGSKSGQSCRGRLAGPGCAAPSRPGRHRRFKSSQGSGQLESRLLINVLKTSNIERRAASLP